MSETKIDASFPDAQFMVCNYHLWRKDRNEKGGGIALYLRSDIPGDRKPDLEFKGIESISVEITLCNKKWLIIGAYKPPPNLPAADFNSTCMMTLDKCSSRYENYMVIGDLNCDLLDQNRSAPIRDLCDIFDLTNVIK